jgi:hypothetical protein
VDLVRQSCAIGSSALHGVYQHDLGPANDRARDAQPLLLADRQAERK